MNIFLCRTCLTNKPESEFYVNHSKTRCRTCCVARVKEHVARINDDSRTIAERHKERWDDKELSILLEGLEEGTPFQELATVLGRTYRATMTKADSVRSALAVDPDGVVAAAPAARPSSARPEPPTCSRCGTNHRGEC